jgi:hypothetical protein
MFPVVVVAAVIFSVGVLLCGPWKLKKWHAYPVVLILIAFVSACLWPVTTHVSGNTQVKLLTENGVPLVGLRVEEEWGGPEPTDRGGISVKITDANGSVHFPPRVTKGRVGLRLVRRGWAFVFNESIKHWEPGLSIKIHLPPGYWLPAGQKVDKGSLDHPYFPRPSHHDPMADPPLLHYGISNSDPLHPHAWVQGRGSGIADDENIELKIRPANESETNAIDGNRSRQNLLKFKLD